MKAQDVAFALALLRMRDEERTIPELSRRFGASTSVVHDAFGRLTRVRLIRPRSYEPVRRNLIEFLEHGLGYVFPAELSRIARGVPTATSAAPLRRVFERGETENEFVWPSASGDQRGTAIKPLHPGVVRAALEDPGVHELIALADGLRVDDPRIRREALKAMRETFDRLD